MKFRLGIKTSYSVKKQREDHQRRNKEKTVIYD